MLSFNFNMNEIATQPMLYPQYTYVMPSTLPQPTLDGKTLPAQIPAQFMMPVSMTGFTPGYTPCLVGENFIQPLQQVPSLPLPSMQFLTPTASPCSSQFSTPVFEPMSTFVDLPPLNLDVYNLDGEPNGREDTPDSSESVSDNFSVATSDLEYVSEVPAPVQTQPETKEQIVPKKLAIIEKMFAGQYDEEGMRGSDIARIKVKTISALNNIVELLEYLSSQMNIIRVSCPKSTKKGGTSVRGFIAYLQVAPSDLQKLETLFGLFNMARDGAFHTIDVNPQKMQKA